MFDVLKLAFQSDAGSFAFVLSIILMVIVGVWYVTKFTTNLSRDVKECKNEDDKLDKKIDKVDSKLDKIKDDIAYIKATIGTINTNNPSGLTQSFSPIGLTDKGKNMAEQMGVRGFIVTNWENILQYIDKNSKSMSAYDIQQLCIETASVSLDRLFTEEDVVKVKLFAFENGQNLVYYGGMIGIIIRDMYFKERSIEISEVDKSDPQKNIIQ